MTTPDSVSITIEGPNFKVTFKGEEIPSPVTHRKDFEKWCRNTIKDKVILAILLGRMDQKQGTETHE